MPRVSFLAQGFRLFSRPARTLSGLAWPHVLSRLSLSMRAAVLWRYRWRNPMDTILVANAGSSSIKFQVFEIEHGLQLNRQIKGKVDGVGTRPELRATS